MRGRRGEEDIPSSDSKGLVEKATGAFLKALAGLERPLEVGVGDIQSSAELAEAQERIEAAAWGILRDIRRVERPTEPAIQVTEEECAGIPGTGESLLVLGWQVDRTRAPTYWLRPDARPGGQESSDLVTVPAGALGCHTAIIAQSGSGKSFFLGRLLEELVLKTKARCIILDPNSDFRRFHEVSGHDLWDDAHYDWGWRIGLLPTEPSREEFVKAWPREQIKIQAANVPDSDDGDNYKRLMLSWSSLSIELVAEELDPVMRSHLRHCHAFLQNIDALLTMKMYLAPQKEREVINVITEAERLLGEARRRRDFVSYLAQEFELTEAIDRFTRALEESGISESLDSSVTSALATLAMEIGLMAPAGVHSVGRLSSPEMSGIRVMLVVYVAQLIDRIAKAPSYIPDSASRYYFSKAREYELTAILDTSIGPEWPQVIPGMRPRVTIVDLPSLPSRDIRLLAINTILNSEWKRARQLWSAALELPQEEDSRVPTFIVVDEAHNLIPVDPRARAEAAIREQFRTIVAEGRKYGLFLILASQRPDKLDPLVLSECENKAVMKLNTGAVLNTTRTMLGLDDLPPGFLEECLEFATGRVLLAGRWVSDTPQLAYVAARRTVEGGRNLRKEYWATPPVLLDPPGHRPAWRRENLPGRNEP